MTRKHGPKPVALITGGARRIGRTLALHLAEHEYSIALHFLTSKTAAAVTAKDIEKQGGCCELFSCDLTDVLSTQALIQSVLDSFGRLDVLVNNASVFNPRRFKDTPCSELDQSYALHLRAPYILMQDFARLQKKGHIINLLDTKISQNTLTHVPYLLMKKALADLTSMAALELAPNFRVNGICPGPVLAPQGKGRSYLQNVGKTVPLQKGGKPEYICSAIDFLLNESYMTGQLLFEDGGAHLL